MHPLIGNKGKWEIKMIMKEETIKAVVFKQQNNIPRDKLQTVLSEDNKTQGYADQIC